jgi:hypothetical protein
MAGYHTSLRPCPLTNQRPCFCTDAGSFHNYVKSTANGRAKVYVKDKSKVDPFHATKTEVLYSFFIWAPYGGEW